MDSSNNPSVDSVFVPGPTPKTWEEAGLTPAYVKVSLEDLANDQIDMENSLSSLQFQVKVVAGAAVMGLALSALLVKMSRMIVAQVQQVAVSLYQTQQHVGLVDAPAQESKPDKTEPVEDDEPAVDGSGLYDPGPQEVPADVAEAIVSEPLPADPHDDGGELR